MKEGERGAAALLSVCAMMAVLMMALGLHMVVKYGAQGSGEYLLETKLRLAAEGRVESLAKEIEEEPSVLDDLPKGKWEPYGAELCEDGILIRTSLRHISALAEGEEDIFLKAWSETEEKSKWGTGKIVCGYMHRKGEKCDWRGWRRVDD